MDKRAVIDPGKCRQEARCTASEVCPAKAFEYYDEEWYIGTLCTGCRKCIRACDAKAIRLG